VYEDSEAKAQSNIFQKILSACDGHPTIRVLQVLVDSLVCTSVATGIMSSDQVVELVRAAYSDVVPTTRN
jgi:hypothetical protein